LLRDKLTEDKEFVEKNKADLCASLQQTVVDILMDKFAKAVKNYGISEIAIAGGVSANSGLRDAFLAYANRHGKQAYIPKLRFTMDNAAMIAVSGYYKFLENEFCDISLPPFARMEL
jgi:N6-L-threonylcarbamoyladenine synthase